MRIFDIITLFIIIVIPLVNANLEQPNLLITLKDILENKNVDYVSVTIKIGNDSLNRFVKENENLPLYLKPGNYETEFKVDSPITDGKDYYGKETITLKDSLTKEVYLYHVGSLRGVVKDKLDNHVDNAKLTFECSGLKLISFPEKTDDVGSFFIEYMPIGKCKIFAEYHGGVGVTEIEMEKGKLHDIEIKLDRTTVSLDRKSYIIPMIILILLISVIIYLLRKRFKLTMNKKAVKDHKRSRNEQIKLVKRSRDVLETLSDKEQTIINFVTNQNGKTSQSRIYQETGIPKASLSRYLQSLERKKIIECQKIGKVKKIRFTKWFLGEEEIKP